MATLVRSPETLELTGELLTIEGFWPLRSWPRRTFTLTPRGADDAPARLSWEGGTRPNSLVLDGSFESSIIEDENEVILVLQTAERALHLRATGDRGDRGVDEWRAAISAVQMRSGYCAAMADGDCCRSLAIFRRSRRLWLLPVEWPIARAHSRLLPLLTLLLPQRQR